MNIDISVDRQVKRVFTRLGLVRDDASPAEVQAVAREFNPTYPGLLDFAVWEIGREWCLASNPKCPDCCMKYVCPTAARLTA